MQSAAVGGRRPSTAYIMIGPAISTQSWVVSGPVLSQAPQRELWYKLPGVKPKLVTASGRFLAVAMLPGPAQSWHLLRHSS